jgi:alpha-ketoglutarate-dependent taurine dioxygenase
MAIVAQVFPTAPPVEFDTHHPRLAEAVRAGIREVGAAVVRGVDVRHDEALLGVVALAGTPSDVGNGGGFIYDVTPRPEGEQVDVSSTDRRFPLHTDSTFLRAPHDVIALGCLAAPINGGGESHLMNVDVALAHIRARPGGDDVVAALGEPAYPFLVDVDGERVIAQLPILRHDHVPVTVRYRDDIIAKAGEAVSIALSARHSAALHTFEAALGDVSLHAVRALRPGDVLIVDNRRMLHGRTAITTGGHRVMRRIKAFA